MNSANALSTFEIHNLLFEPSLLEVDRGALARNDKESPLFADPHLLLMDSKRSYARFRESCHKK